MGWFARNAATIEAAGTLVMAGVAVLALVGVKLQIDANDRIQREQSAREIYRDFLALTVAHPDLAHPDGCRGVTGPADPAYDGYLEYLLYTAEQTTRLDLSWDPMIGHWLGNHAGVLCAIDDWSGYTSEVEALIRQARIDICDPAPVCN